MDAWCWAGGRVGGTGGGGRGGGVSVYLAHKPEYAETVLVQSNGEGVFFWFFFVFVFFFFQFRFTNVWFCYFCFLLQGRGKGGRAGYVRRGMTSSVTLLRRQQNCTKGEKRKGTKTVIDRLCFVVAVVSYIAGGGGGWCIVCVGVVAQTYITLGYSLEPQKVYS